MLSRNAYKKSRISEDIFFDDRRAQQNPKICIELRMDPDAISEPRHIACLRSISVLVSRVSTVDCRRTPRAQETLIKV